MLCLNRPLFYLCQLNPAVLFSYVEDALLVPLAGFVNNVLPPLPRFRDTLLFPSPDFRDNLQLLPLGFGYTMLLPPSGIEDVVSMQSANDKIQLCTKLQPRACVKIQLCASSNPMPIP